MEFVVVTGLSGAGKTRAMHAMEDIGFFCVDNLPAKLIPTIFDLCKQTKSEKVAVVTDIRAGELFSDLMQVLESMRSAQCEFRILFLDASDTVLIHRYQETRRRHPLADRYQGSLEEAVSLEREMLRPLRECADYVVDTTYLTTAQLKQRMSTLFLGEISDALSIHCMSFGFKHGIPTESDLLFDVRCLPNPYYVDELRQQTGLDEPVREYVMRWPETQGFVTRLLDLVDYMLPLYCSEGKSQLVIAIGCTGGHHRSVAIAQHLYSHLAEKGQRVSVQHRDIRK